MTGELVPFPPRQRDATTWEPWVDEPTVARHFSVSTRTIRRWRDAGMPSRVLIGGARRYRLSACEAWHDLQQSA